LAVRTQAGTAHISTLRGITIPVTRILQEHWWVWDKFLAYLFMSPSITFAFFRCIADVPIRLLSAVALTAILFSCVAETSVAQSVTSSVFSVTRDLNGDDIVI